MATRREVLKAAAAAGGWLVFNRFGFAADDKKLLPMTPNITMGPFYPQLKPLDKDADLTQIAGRSGRAQGQVLHVSGRVLNRNGDPVRHAKLELWQANARGGIPIRRTPTKRHSIQTSKAMANSSQTTMAGSTSRPSSRARIRDSTAWACARRTSTLRSSAGRIAWSRNCSFRASR